MATRPTKTKEMINMPKVKRVYVRDEDIPIFDKAEKMFEDESFSSLVARLIRSAVEQEEAKEKGLREVEIEVGSSGPFQRVRFFGKDIASFRDEKGIRWTLYLTGKGKFLLHRMDQNDSHSDYSVHESLEEIKDAPDALIRAAEEALGKENTIHLDV